MDYIKLLRIPNLVFIAAIQLLMYFCVLTPILGVYGLTPAMSVTELMLLVISSVLIAGGGYVINDYFDMKIDEINHPFTRVVGKTLTRHQAMVFYQVLSVMGTLTGLYLCFKAHSITYVFVYLMVLGLLWFYSSTYKRQLVLGNFIVAFLAAMVPFIVGLFEIRFMDVNYTPSEDTRFIGNLVITWMGGFGICAFLWTFIREIVKDMEDEKGDRELECHTFPVVLGFARTKVVVFVSLAITLGICAYFTFYLIPFDDPFTYRYYILGIVIPSFFFVYILASAKKKADYKLASTVLKMIMVVGMLYAVVVTYEVNKYEKIVNGEESTEMTIE